MKGWHKLLTASYTWVHMYSTYRKQHQGPYGRRMLLLRQAKHWKGGLTSYPSHLNLLCVPDGPYGVEVWTVI
jgi:hypothetical protein